MTEKEPSDDRPQDSRLARADRRAVLAFRIAVLGVACYLAFILLGETWFASICKGSWQSWFS